ncbi:PglL family O-oligosaccharyltransferase [Pseudomonas sp. N040]|uniref:PglL family O-oligosaccharyltransferase n=1 Tax=Pseudomonas sp. N040 TaxID=2785325 RepID=UPI00280BE5FC|nr:Wzy polymerase domain-containing protein [Pseudomonas sp. N040]
MASNYQGVKRGMVKVDVTKNGSFAPESVSVVWCLWAFLLVVALAFLQPLHIWPFANHLENIGLGAAVVVLAGVLLLLRGRFLVNALCLWWLGFGGLLLVSSVTVAHPFDSSLYAYAGFWIVGMAVIQLGGCYGWQHEPQLFAGRMAWFLFGLSLLSLVLGLAKFYGVWAWLALYFPDPGTGRLQGLIGQSNYFAVLLLLGGVSGLWLLHVRQLPVWLSAPLGLLYCYGLVLSGTRVIYLIYAVVVLIAVIQASRVRRYGLVGWLLAFALLFVLVRPAVFELDQQLTIYLKSIGLMPWPGISADLFKAREGFLADSRFGELRIAWQVMLEALPWGVGPGGYAGASYTMHLQAQAPLTLLWNHSHNSYLQLLLEFGIPGLLWMLGMGVMIASVLWRAIGLDQPIQAIILSALLVYSFFEFPLWLMSFFVLGFFVLAAGMPSREVSGGRLLGAGVIVAALAALFFYMWIFAELVRFYFAGLNPELKAGDAIAVDFRFIDRMVQDPLLAPDGLKLYYKYYELSPRMLSIELEELARMYRYRPIYRVSSRYAMALAMAGRKEEALRVRDQMLAVFPKSKDEFRRQIEAVIRAQPSAGFDFLLAGLPADSEEPAR